MQRRALLLGGVAALTIGVWGCGSDSDSQITMGTSPDYPPYEFYGSAGGEQTIIGFDVDIADRIATELGLELQIEAIEFSELIPALEAEQVDFVMAGMTPTAERQQRVDFSQVYFIATTTIVAKQDSGITTTADLEGRRVGVQLDSIQEGEAEDLAETVPDLEIVSLGTLGEIVQQVKSDQIDAAIIEDTVAKGFTASNPELIFTPIPSEGPRGSAVAFPKGSERVEEFNRILGEMQQSGEMEELVLKWFGDTAPAAAP